MSKDLSEEFLLKAESHWLIRWPLLIAAVLLMIVVGASWRLLAKPKQQVSAEDALAIVKLQSKIVSIQKKLTEETDALRKKADTEAAPYFKEGQAIQTRVCKANGFGTECYIDIENMTVLAKAPAPTAPAIPSTPIGQQPAKK
jgi:hypothetical protein